jgi:hypothetical protein
MYSSIDHLKGLKMFKIAIDPDHLDDVAQALETLISELSEQLQSHADVEERSPEQIIKEHVRFSQLLTELSGGQFKAPQMLPEDARKHLEKERDSDIQMIGELQNKINQMRLLLDLVQKSNCSMEQIWQVHNAIRNTLVYKVQHSVICGKFSQTDLIRIESYSLGLMPILHTKDELRSLLDS